MRLLEALCLDPNVDRLGGRSFVQELPEEVREPRWVEHRVGLFDVAERPPAHLVDVFRRQPLHPELRPRLECRRADEDDLFALIERLTGPREHLAPRPDHRPEPRILETRLFSQLPPNRVLDCLPNRPLRVPGLPSDELP